MLKHKIFHWTNPLLAILLVLSLATTAALAAPKDPKKQKNQKNQKIQKIQKIPIPTKAGKQAALQEAVNSVMTAAPTVQRMAVPSAQRMAVPPAQLRAAPTANTDQTKIPHYYGPFPNWANSPFALADATVAITGDGTGATAIATVGLGGAVTDITITNPGSGYTAATLEIGGTGSGATADALVSTAGSVTSILVDTPGNLYTSPSVYLSGGGGTGNLMQVGNSLTERQYATDSAANVFVVVPNALPDGQLQNILTLNQATSGGSTGYAFNAYVLRPTGTPNEYTVIFDSNPLTVPALTTPGVSEVVRYPVSVAVQAGDVLGFYGQGIPLDIGAGGDKLVFPADTVPLTGDNIILGNTVFPLYPQARAYSFAAEIIDTSGVAPLADATATAYGGVDVVTLIEPGTGPWVKPTIDFDMPDGSDGVKATAHAEVDSSGNITAIVVDSPGSGYSYAPSVVIRDGTVFDPILNGGVGATATTTLTLQTISMVSFGDGYTAPPTVSISDSTGNGSGATATAFTDFGAVTAINVTAPGSGYIAAGGIKKFQDALPLLCDPSVSGDCVENGLGQYLPLGVPDVTTFSSTNLHAPTAPDADYYVIGLVQTRERMNSSLHPNAGEGALVREYVQLQTPANAAWSKGIPLTNTLLDGTKVPIYYPGTTTPVLAVDNPHWLGPVLAAQKDRPVRIVFYNFLPEGADGDLFLPKDSTIMGAGPGPVSPINLFNPQDLGNVMDEVRNPLCTDDPSNASCFQDNRATLHMHGGITPWISDGTPHQWISPAVEKSANSYPQGASVGSVPDMAGVMNGAGTYTVPDCSAVDDGCQTYYYTNQQSARLMFYHDHAWGITRLGVFAGEAAGYLIADKTEKKLIDAKIIPADQIPLIIQDRTFVPDVNQLAWQDPTWDSSSWGGMGNFWYHHVYMPAQNPGDPTGMSAFGRWMYGPWFWPPADPLHGPIANPYYNMDPKSDFVTALAVPCDVNDPATWQYDTDPFCEPELIPGTPNVSVGMEQFNDTPIVNGTAYPTTTVEPKAYRLRILNAANDRFFNFQWYVGDPNTASSDTNDKGMVIGATEVALNPAELAAAQIDPNIFPTPVDSSTATKISTAGPDWIVIGSEGGFLPAPVVIDGQQPTTWVIDPTVFNVGNVDKHSLLVAPAERFDVIVDFSKFAGKTLILYNDAPAAFPARVASYDYYTGAPDLSPVGAPTILPGYGPNTRTIMQVKVAGTPAPAFNLGALQAAFRHKADGSGVFESSQHPIIVGQAPYNSAYGTNFAASSYCNGNSNSQRCDGYLRIADQGGTLFGFNTLLNQTGKLQIKIEPKAIHDEMNAAAFDEFGRMTANIGVEVVPATPALQNIVLYPYVNPPTEMIDATKLPKNNLTTMTPISPISEADGTQIWKITHNGVDTHPLHWHLYDVQVLNRVTWDNIVSPPHPTELGWKDTVRVSPLEDTIIALRPIIPELPWDLPNSIRPLHPMIPLGSEMGFNNIDADGNPTAPITNQLINYGSEYVWHCHILSHEEMDMMRPVAVAMPPIAPSGLVFDATTKKLSWSDNSLNETSFLVQRSTDGGATWPVAGTVVSPLDQVNTKTGGLVLATTYTDSTYEPKTASQYRVVAQNTIGYGGEFMELTAQSAVSDSITVGGAAQPLLYFSTAGNSNPPGVSGTADDADIYSGNNTSFTRVWDASVNGLPGNANIDGLVVVSPTDFYLSFTANNTNVPGLGNVQDEDVVHFINGTWSVYFDGTARGLTNNNQDLDAFSIVGGNLYFSTAGNTNPPGVGGTADDADIYRFNGTSFARVWDASVNGLPNNANVDGLKYVDATHFYLSFRGNNTNVPGIGNVQDEDIVYYNNGSWSVYFDGTARGLTNNNQNIDAFDIQ